MVHSIYVYMCTMYVCIHVCICICICICVCLCICICICICISICICICIIIRICFTYVSMNVYMYICTHVYMDTIIDPSPGRFAILTVPRRNVSSRLLLALLVRAAPATRSVQPGGCDADVPGGGQSQRCGVQGQRGAGGGTEGQGCSQEGGDQGEGSCGIGRCHG